MPVILSTPQRELRPRVCDHGPNLVSDSGLRYQPNRILVSALA